MVFGIFAKVFSRQTVEEIFEAVRAHGLSCVQFNMSCCGLPAMPDAIDAAIPRRVRQAASAHGISISALSGTFNMIHPDPQQRRDGLRRLRVLAAAANEMGTRVITVCTGSRDPEDMWRRHPDNDSRSAWADLTESLREALRIASDHDLILGVEPEVSNTVDSASKARQLLDELASPQLKIVMDPANLFHEGELSRMRQVMESAFELLGRELILAHAKDLSADGEAGQEAAGTGRLDYDLYLSLLRRSGFSGPLILHSLKEAQVPGCTRFLKERVAASSGS